MELRSPFPVEHLWVYDLQGRLVRQATLNGRTRATLDLGPLPAGAYQLVLGGAGQRAALRFLRE